MDIYLKTLYNSISIANREYDCNIVSNYPQDILIGFRKTSRQIGHFNRSDIYEGFKNFL